MPAVWALPATTMTRQRLPGSMARAQEASRERLQLRAATESAAMRTDGVSARVRTAQERRMRRDAGERLEKSDEKMTFG